MLAESISISGPELGLVTVTVIEEEESVHTLPLPANIYFASNGDKHRGNLAFRMLKTKLHELSHLPFPLPLAAGMWLHVSVEGQECQLRNGEEIEPTVYCSDASKVGLRVFQISSNDFEAEDPDLHSDIKHSLGITEEQVSRLTIGFLTFKQRLQESAKTASFPDELLIGRPVLGLSLSRRRNL